MLYLVGFLIPVINTMMTKRFFVRDCLFALFYFVFRKFIQLRMSTFLTTRSVGGLGGFTLQCTPFIFHRQLPQLYDQYLHFQLFHESLPMLGANKTLIWIYRFMMPVCFEKRPCQRLSLPKGLNLYLCKDRCAFAATSCKLLSFFCFY